MNELLGNLGLCFAVLASSAALLVSLISMRFTGALLPAARNLIMLVLATLTLSSYALVRGLVNSDFSIHYIASYTERALPLGYKLAAFWAGQEGSLLLWAWLLAGMAVVFVMHRRRESAVESAVSIATVAAALLFFSALLLFAANPFQTLAEVPADGRGLNPMLQDPWMLAHPPLLFIGYAGYLFPFALLIGALVSRRRDPDWLAALRPWAMISWLFLGLGILFGAQWAYIELGWGGYWAWDPVENASLLPWLTGTALLHSIMGQQHRGMFKKWNAFLIAVTFILCIFGTYLTRSGIVQSVHAFEGSLVSTFFLGFLATLVIFSLVMIYLRRKELAPEHTLDGLIGREGVFLATNVLLVGMTLLTLIGTIFPVITRSIAGQEVTVKASFYNTVVAPMGLALVALMALGPMLTYGHQAAARFAKAFAIPAILAAVAVGGAVAAGYRNPWALICVGITTVAILAILLDLVRAARHRAHACHENLLLAVVRLIDANHRRYGGQLVHVGMLLIMVGIVGSSVFATHDTKEFRPGEKRDIAGRTIEFVGLDEIRKGNYTAVEAEVRVTEANGRTMVLRPQRRFYDKSEQPNAEVAIRSTWREDLYVSLAGWEAGGALTALQIHINPLMSLLWAGGIVLTLGGLLCITPRILRHAPVEPELSAAAKVPPVPTTPVGRKARRGREAREAVSA